MKSTARRFMEKVAKTEGGCWIWDAGKVRGGYGHFWLDGRDQKAHRVAYELFVGRVPDGLVIDHLCRATTTPRRRACGREAVS